MRRSKCLGTGSPYIGPTTVVVIRKRSSECQYLRDPVISAFGTPGTGEYSNISALSTPGIGEYSVIPGFGTPGTR